MNYPMYQPYQRQGNTRLWVQGEAGAKSYLVAPNSSVDLWDSEKPVIYVKSADPTGMPSMRIIDYKFRDNVPAQGFVTKDELNELKSYIDSRLSEVKAHDERSADSDDVQSVDK